MSKDLTIESFQPCVGSDFQIQLNSSSLPLSLAECEPLNLSIRQPARGAFRLVFHGPLRPVLPQRIYTLAHEQLGALDIFIVPIGPQGQAMQYEAIFT